MTLAAVTGLKVTKNAQGHSVASWVASPRSDYVDIAVDGSTVATSVPVAITSYDLGVLLLGPHGVSVVAFAYPSGGAFVEFTA